MSNLHPTMANALDPFLQAMSAAGSQPAALTLPAIKKPMQRDSWRPDPSLPALVVDFIHYPALYGRRDEWGQLSDPDYPAGCEIQAVWLAGYDIYSLLSEDVLSQIEAYFSPSEG